MISGLLRGAIRELPVGVADLGDAAAIVQEPVPLGAGRMITNRAGHRKTGGGANATIGSLSSYVIISHGHRDTDLGFHASIREIQETCNQAT
jgi:hypothetical protein